MSAASVDVVGQRRLVGLTPDDSSEATILTAGPEHPVIVGVMIANLTDSAVNATVKWGDGSSDFAIVDTHQIAARSYLHLDVMLPLHEGGTIKVTSGTGGALAFSLVVVEFGSRASG